MKRAIGILIGFVLLYLGLSLWPGAPAPKATWLEGGPAVLVIAHGTGQGIGPQNTLETALLAFELGADVIELDVHLTADSHLVVIHDATLEATTDGAGAVAEMTLEEIQAFDAAVAFTDASGVASLAGQGVVVPTLAAIFEALPAASYLIEIKPKAPGADQALCDLLQEYGLEAQTMVGSFHVAALRRFRRICPEVATSMSEAEVETFVYLHLIGLSNLAPLNGSAVQVPPEAAGIRILSPGFVEDAHKRGLAVHAWTINDPAEMRKLVEIGVDGLITDYPGRALRVLER